MLGLVIPYKTTVYCVVGDNCVSTRKILNRLEFMNLQKDLFVWVFSNTSPWIMQFNGVAIDYGSSYNFSGKSIVMAPLGGMLWPKIK